ncbi:hypothetical protein JCM18899A_11580 [Nocardioides sp. AN3]
MDTWAIYVRELTRDEPQDAVGRKVGVDGSTISRWRNGKVGKVVEVAALARAYEDSVLRAFVAAGFLTAEEAKTPPPGRPDWDTVSHQQMLDELALRLRAADERDGLWSRRRLSAAADSPDHGIAAHDHVSISEEQEGGDEA